MNGAPIALEIGTTQKDFEEKIPQYSKYLIHLDHSMDGIGSCKKYQGSLYCKLPVLKPLLPADYFKTTGDAIAKLEQMEKDAWALAGAIRALKNLAKKSRGTSAYLETCPENPERLIDNKVWAQVKNPRENGKSRKQNA